MLIVALFAALARLAIGPTLPDRVVALDLVAAVAVGMLTEHAISSDEQWYIDVAIAVALIAFLGTVAFARYVERRAQGD